MPKRKEDPESSSSSSSEDEEDSSGDESVENEQKSSSNNKKRRIRDSLQTNNNKKKTVVAPLEVVVGNGGGTLTSGIRSGSNNERPVIVLLDQATCETVKNKRGDYELLNCDDHRDLCRKKLRKDPNAFRPDILHQELLALLDSPLNKAGLLKVYIRTQKNVLIDVNPAIRIPRTYKRFSGLIVQLLHKMKIKAGKDSTTLLKIVKNPFSQYLPAGTHCYGFSCQGDLYSPIALAKNLLPLQPGGAAAPVCFIVGAMSTGHVKLEDHPYMEKMLSISEYPLSGASALSRIMGGIEHHWGIV